MNTPPNPDDIAHERIVAKCETARDVEVADAVLMNREYKILRGLRDINRDVCKCGHVRRAHRTDTPWQRCGNTACKHEHCGCEEFRIRVHHHP